MFPFMKISAALLSLLLFSGCASSASIESAAESGYHKTPRSLSVRFQAGPLANEIKPSFDLVFLDYMGKCGIRASSGLSGNYSGPGPDDTEEWVLFIKSEKAVSSQLMMHGVPVGPRELSGVAYNATLFDLELKRKVWRANLSVSIHRDTLISDHDSSGRDAAIAVIKKMREDGLLGRCMPPKE